MKKQTFALYFGNRGFMPAELIEGAREDMIKAVTDAGYDCIYMDLNYVHDFASSASIVASCILDTEHSFKELYDGILDDIPKALDGFAQDYAAH